MKFPSSASAPQEDFHSTYSSIGANRNSETLSIRQTAPSSGNGADLLWNHHGGNWNIVTGADVDQDRGFSYDHLVPTGTRVGGGTLLQHGEFVQGDYRIGGLQLFGGARHQFTGQDRQFFSPSAGPCLRTQPLESPRICLSRLSRAHSQ